MFRPWFFLILSALCAFFAILALAQFCMPAAVALVCMIFAKLWYRLHVAELYAAEGRTLDGQRVRWRRR